MRNNWMCMAQCAMGSIIQVAPQYAAILVEIARIYDCMIVRLLDGKYGLICDDRVDFTSICTVTIRSVMHTQVRKYSDIN